MWSPGTYAEEPYHTGAAYKDLLDNRVICTAVQQLGKNYHMVVTHVSMYFWLDSVRVNLPFISHESHVALFIDIYQNGKS